MDVTDDDCHYGALTKYSGADGLTSSFAFANLLLALETREC